METLSEKDLVSAVSNLTDIECTSLQAVLHSNKIPFIVNEHGAHGEYQSFYFEIKVQKRHAEFVRQIIAKHKSRVFLDSKKCPKCSHLGYRRVDQVKWFVRLYYWGTTLVECNKCKTRFGV